MFAESKLDVWLRSKLELLAYQARTLFDILTDSFWSVALDALQMISSRAKAFWNKIFKILLNFKNKSIGQHIRAGRDFLLEKEVFTWRNSFGWKFFLTTAN